MVSVICAGDSLGADEFASGVMADHVGIDDAGDTVETVIVVRALHVVHDVVVAVVAVDVAVVVADDGGFALVYKQ